jgi:mRNA interferase MazF
MLSSSERIPLKTLSTIPSGDMFGEIFLCEFPFTSGAAGKVRPALILFDLKTDVLICRITSAQRNGLLDIALLDWQEAGLLRPSAARLDRLVTAERRIFRRRLGVLSKRARGAVRDIWNQQMKL